MSKNISYSAVVLDEKSHELLISKFEESIPKGWEVIAHHMTITLGPLRNAKGKYDMSEQYPLGAPFSLNVIRMGRDDRAMAVEIRLPEGYSTRSQYPHITVAVNRKEGGKPWHSNQIDKGCFEDCAPFTLTGIVEEVPQKPSASGIDQITSKK
ncbi:MAG: hypothetical protein VX278_10775 [Myxococcota bacterium]|nr:hypothetical protein [Myxococcota bacterium]